MRTKRKVQELSELHDEIEPDNLLGKWAIQLNKQIAEVTNGKDLQELSDQLLASVVEILCEHTDAWREFVCSCRLSGGTNLDKDGFRDYLTNESHEDWSIPPKVFHWLFQIADNHLDS